MDLLNLSGYMSLCKRKLWSYSFQQVSKNTKFAKNICGLGKQNHTLLSDTTELLTTSIALKDGMYFKGHAKRKQNSLFGELK